MHCYVNEEKPANDSDELAMAEACFCESDALELTVQWLESDNKSYTDVESSEKLSPAFCTIRTK